MSKKLTVQLDEPLHHELTGAAHRAGVSVHAWMINALSHEIFRQLTAEAAAWCAQHPSQAADYATRHAARRVARRGAANS